MTNTINKTVNAASDLATGPVSSKKFKGSIIATISLMAITFSPGFGVPTDVVKEALYYLFVINALFFGSQGVQDFMIARNGNGKS